jgi:hypothetical protein
LVGAVGHTQFQVKQVALAAAVVLLAHLRDLAVIVF